jgi:hypothetical protein
MPLEIQIQKSLGGPIKDIVFDLVQLNICRAK